MKTKILLTDICTLLCCALQPVYAAFPVGHSVASIADPHENSNPTTRYTPPIPTQHKKAVHRTGKLGIWSVVCGVLGLIPLTSSILLGACAILLGIAGLNKERHKNTGFAIAGIILGVGDIAIWIALISTLGMAALFVL